MATAHNQIALTNSFPTSMNKIPPFLQKLYKIVSDPATDHVIAWAGDGNSFYIHDQATLEAEVLPRWFKTNKTAAFVRQLNKYGFRKVTHLQQGVLKRDSELESSQYVHPDFLQGREDMLSLINEGKKQIHSKEPLVVDSISTEASSSSAGVPALRQNLDVTAVISDIRRNQARLTQELTELKQADRALWDEAHRSLQRYQQQQNTINLIVQFLGNLLGQIGSKDKTHESHTPVPVQQQRLMIEDNQHRQPQQHEDHHQHTPPQDDEDTHSSNARIQEVTEEDEDHLFTLDDEPIIETPGSFALPSSILPQAASPSAFDLTNEGSDSQLMKLTDPTLSPILNWTDVLSSFGPLANDASFSEFLSNLPSSVGNGGSITQPSDLQSHISEIERSVGGLSSDIDNLQNLITLPPSSGLPDDFNAYINFDAPTPTSLDGEEPQPQPPLQSQLESQPQPPQPQPQPPQPQPQPPPQQHIQPMDMHSIPPASVPPPPVTRGQKRKSDVMNQPEFSGSTPLFTVNASVPEPPNTRTKYR